MLEPTIEDVCTRRTLRAAFERVRGNGGCRGADGTTLGRFGERLEEELDHLEDRLRSRRYHPYPLLRFPIPKPRHGIRYRPENHPAKAPPSAWGDSRSFKAA